MRHCVDLDILGFPLRRWGAVPLVEVSALGEIARRAGWPTRGLSQSGGTSATLHRDESQLLTPERGLVSLVQEPYRNMAMAAAYRLSSAVRGPIVQTRTAWPQ